MNAFERRCKGMTSTHNHPKKHYYDRAISYDALRDGLNRCCRGVRWKDSVVGYEHNAAKNTHGLRKDLLEGKYRISPYQTFTIHEPKEREIVATRIRDRQMQMALCQSGLYDDMVEHFIYDNCACQIGKGTDFALKRLRCCWNWTRKASKTRFFRCRVRALCCIKTQIRSIWRSLSAAMPMKRPWRS